MECCYLRNVQKILMKGDLELNIVRFLHETSLGLHQCGKKVLPGVFLRYGLIGESLEWRYFGRRHWRRRRKDGRIGNLSSKKQRKTKYDRHKRDNNSYSQLQKAQQNCQEETTNSENPLWAGTTCMEWRSQWRTGRSSTDRISRWRWSPERLLGDSWWLHLSSSHWTSSSTLCAEKRNIPYSTAIHWCDQGNLHKSKCVARKKYRWLLECGRESKSIRFLNRIHKVHFSLKKKPPKGWDWQEFKQLPDLRMYGLKCGPKLGKPL